MTISSARARLFSQIKHLAGQDGCLRNQKGTSTFVWSWGTLRVGGSSYIDVSWKCSSKSNSNLDVFEFVFQAFWLPILAVLVRQNMAIHSSASLIIQSPSVILHGNSGQLRGDLVAEAEKPPLPWELTRLGAHAALRTKQMAENGALRGALWHRLRDPMFLC